MSRSFIKEKLLITNDNVKSCSTSLIIRKAETKILMRYHYNLTQMAAGQSDALLQVRMCNDRTQMECDFESNSVLFTKAEQYHLCAQGPYPAVYPREACALRPKRHAHRGSVICNGCKLETTQMPINS